MSRLGWLAAVPVVVWAVIFALSNRAPVALDLWPLPVEPAVPLYGAVLGPLGLGILAGAALAWAAAVPARRRARDVKRRAESLERQLGALRGRVEGSDAP